MTVADLKTKVAEATSIAIESQRLLSSGNEMENTKVLYDYFQANSQVCRVVSFRSWHMYVSALLLRRSVGDTERCLTGSGGYCPCFLLRYMYFRRRRHGLTTAVVLRAKNIPSD